ncbi:MAG: carboxylesterase family protein, partial [Paraburkholderia sp.]|uniref:carboxylesterase family protein n=1 Tax=Paraburkholderia sp. TaxID=1926495 RepID=UPI003C43B692
MSADTEALYGCLGSFRPVPKHSIERLTKMVRIAMVAGASMLAATLAHAVDDSMAVSPASNRPIIAAPVIKTSQGALRGSEHGVVDVYQAIPYGAPPIGDLRWRAPQPAPA